jgi:hypothetical protein
VHSGAAGKKGGNESMKSMKCSLCLCVAAGILAGCASGKSLQWTGQDVFEGHGGAVEKAGGIDIYLSGEPNGKFKVLGMVEGSYYHGGNILLSLASAASAKNKLVKATKELGGDAVIILSRNYETFGASTVGSANANTTGSINYPSYSANTSMSFASHTTVHGAQGGTAAIVKYLY